MSAQPVNPNTLKRLAKDTGLSLKYGMAHGGTVVILTTRTHQHYVYDKRTGSAQKVKLEFHYNTCPGGIADDGDWDEPIDFPIPRGSRKPKPRT